MISLIVPVYNIRAYLDRCISSILSQTYKEFELILVDDGSTDGSSELCDSYVRQDGRITVIHKENGGLVSARKAGVAAAQGEYIGFVDGDDWLEPRMYEHMVGSSMRYGADMVLGGCIEDADGQVVHKTNFLKAGTYILKKLRKDIYPYMLCAEDFSGMGVQPYLWNKLVRRGVAYASIMAVDDRIRVGEDVAAVMSMLLQADQVVITDYCDYHYCVRKTSMMWDNGNEEREWAELCILHKFLYSTFSVYLSPQFRLKRQLSHYTIGNMLTRAYGKLASKDGTGILWPFGYHIDNNKCIVYSAGNFGRAVYGYLQKHCQEKCVLWVDQKYQMYQSLGMPVCSVEDVLREKQADILIAVLNLKTAEIIQENLLHLGISDERIYCINITEEEVKEILSSI